VADPFQMVEEEVRTMNTGIMQLVSNKHPLLSLMARYYFAVPGKRFRPTVVLLIGQACLVHGRPLARHIQLAEIIEMIHTASLAHDDVLDEAATRRGHPSLNASHGNKLSILVGDFLLARASVSLAGLRDHRVTELLSNMIAELVEGEFIQMRPQQTTMDMYLRKTYLKTASMISNAAQSAAILSGAPESWIKAVADYGTNLGMAFQITDDILDFEPSSITGKPSQGDLRSGIITAPILYAMETSADLRDILFVRGGSEDGSVRKGLSDSQYERVVDLLKRAGGLEKAIQLAKGYSVKAKEALSGLPDTHSRQVLNLLADKVLSRKH
jgi:all-trans-nonaprenyl-diphosphate synthase